MGINRNAAVNDRLFYRITGIIRNNISLFVCFVPFHAVGRIVPERISFVSQEDCVPTGSRNRRSLKNAGFTLNNGSFFRRQHNRSAACIGSLHEVQVPGAYQTVQGYAIHTGNRNSLRIASCRNSIVYLRFVVSRNTDTACHSVYFMINPCIVARSDRNAAGCRIYRAVNNNVLYCLQIHVTACINLTVDAVVFGIRKTDCTRFQIAFAGRHKVACYFNQPKPHGGIIAACTVHAFHISVFACQIDEHAVVSQVAAVLFRCSCIIQDTDRICRITDYPVSWIGFQFQHFARVQESKRIIRIRRHGKSFGRIKRNGIARIHGTYP